MRVVLAGASGAIGRYLVPQLRAANHEVIGITRTAGSLAGSGAREVVADVLDRPTLLAALDGLKADAVIHQLTALSKAPATSRDMRETNRLRAEGTSTLIAAARRLGAKKFVAASFFGGYGLIDHGRTPVLESAPFGELDGRADAVQMALLSLEQQVHAFGGVCLRFGLFYDGTTSPVSPVSAIWNGVLPMLHLSDAAAATVRVLARYKQGAIYNIADDQPVTYRDREIARAEAAGLRAPRQLPDSVLRLAAPFGGLLLTRASIILSTARAATELGWKPEYPSLAKGLGVAVTVPTKVAMPVRVAERVPERTPIAVPEPTPALVAESKAVAKVKPAPGPKPQPVADAKPKPVPVRHPKAPAASSVPVDPFRDSDSAIARIGVPHDN